MKCIAYIDKKWFYVTNCHCKVKKLPLGPHEVEGADAIEMPKTQSQRFPVKSMFMGVVGKPRPDKNFDGKILFKRVSKNVTVKQD